MRSAPFVVPLVLAFAQPAHAQQVDQQTRQQVESTVAQYVDALNNGDGQAWVALFGPNPIDVGPSGKTTNAAQMKSVIERDHQRGLDVTAKVEDVELLFGGQGVVATASYSATYSNPRMQQQVQGSFLFVLERGGGGWKIRAASATRLQRANRGVVQLAQGDSLPLRPD
jgi:ketosteroid isomerase-like protein